MSGVSAIFTINNSITRCFSHFIKICYPLCRELPKQEDLCLQKTPDMKSCHKLLIHLLLVGAIPFFCASPVALYFYSVESTFYTAESLGGSLFCTNIYSSRILFLPFSTPHSPGCSIFQSIFL